MLWLSLLSQLYWHRPCGTMLLSWIFGCTAGAHYHVSCGALLLLSPPSNLALALFFSLLPSLHICGKRPCVLLSLLQLSWLLCATNTAFRAQGIVTLSRTLTILSTPASASSPTTATACQHTRDVFRATEPHTTRPKKRAGDTEEVRPRPRRVRRTDALGAFSTANPGWRWLTWLILYL